MDRQYLDWAYMIGYVYAVNNEPGYKELFVSDQYAWMKTLAHVCGFGALHTNLCIFAFNRNLFVRYWL